jgi:ribonuclease HI
MIIQHCFKPKPGTRRETSEPRKWSPPPPGEVLVNSDAALFDHCRSMSMGAVIRDSDGKCLVAASIPLEGFTSPEIAEALALRAAVSLTRDRGFDKAIFATDCLSLVQRLCSSTPDRSQVGSVVQDRSQVGSVVQDIRVMAADFSVVSFRHVNRSLNEAAHILARSYNLASQGFISDFAPECIRETLCNDVV